MPGKLIPLLVVSILAFTGAGAQQTGTNCGVYMRRIFYYAQKGAHFTGSLDEYFRKALPDKSESGSFKLKLVIDSVGNLDRLTIDSNSTGYTPEEIRTCIDNMPAWLPATQNGYPVTFCVMLKVTVDKGKETVTYKNEQPFRPH